jgi:phage gp16-like protein
MNDDDFSEELDNLSSKAFGHTNWEYHADTDLKKFVIIFNIKEEEDTEELLTKGQ